MKTSFVHEITLIVLAVLNFVSVRASIADNKPVPVATVDWDKLKSDGRLKSGDVIPGKKAGDSSWLKIVNTHPGMQSIPLCEIESPPITTPSYAVRGRIRYENVVGTGFLEMWNHFDGEQQYFSRTMATEGLMQTVTGTSLDRDFELPFHTGGQAPAPKKLVLNLVLNGPGTVEIGPMELVPIQPIAGMDPSAPAWWSDSTGGLIGGIGGSMLGIFGGVIGTLMGVGKGKKIVLCLAALATICGAVTVVAGIVAVVNRQPYSVYYVMLLMGGMLTFFGIMVISIAPARYRAHELRRMQALDV